MLSKNLSNTDIEDIYDTLALAIDQAGEQNESKLLTKAVLILSNMLGDKTQVTEAIRIAELDL